MSTVIKEMATTNLTQDGDLNRTYRVDFLIKGTTNEGAADALIAMSNAVSIGDPYNVAADSPDLWALRKPDTSIARAPDEEKKGIGRYWVASCTFSTKPDKRCVTVPVEDPLLEPPKVSGSFVRYQEEASLDRFGNPIRTSSFEQFKGKQVEFDANRPQLKIEMNFPVFSWIETIHSMIDTVNGYPIWGLAARCWKLSSAPWQRKYKGVCETYFSCTLEFDGRLDTFDRDLLDQGTKALNGHSDANSSWILDNINGNPPNPLNPSHFIRYTDRKGQPTTVILNGAGVPALTGVGAALYSVATAALVAGGDGYKVGDILGVSGGFSMLVARVRVTTVGGGSGEVITGISLIDPGSYTTKAETTPPGPIGLYAITGTGSLATATLTWTTTPVVCNSAVPGNWGSGYLVDDLLVVQGGTPTTSPAAVPPATALPPFTAPSPPGNSSATVLKVTAVGQGGAILAAIIDSPGSYSAQPANPVQTLGSLTGVNATFTLGFGASTTKVDSVNQPPSVVGSGGGYTAGDVLTVVGGTGTAAELTVLTVTGPGEVATVSVLAGGTYTVNPPFPDSVTGGTGSGATFDLAFVPSFAANVPNPSAPGSIHVEVYGESDFLTLGLPLVFDD